MDYVKQWLLDPSLDKLLVAVIGVSVILTLAGVVRRSLSRSVAESQTRYRIRKLVTFLAYTLVILFLGIVFKDRLGGLTVALGIAGAGVAFALQEIIASIAGWVAVSFGGFYASGDRIQLGGIKGDVIDAGILRTTLMECGEWVRSDQYTGRIGRVANSFVFKEPVFTLLCRFSFSLG